MRKCLAWHEVCSSGGISEYTYVDPDTSSWTIGGGLYLTVTILSGSSNVNTTRLFHLLVDGTEIEKEVIGVPAGVPEPATSLLVGTGLVGLAEFRRKFGK